MVTVEKIEKSDAEWQKLLTQLLPTNLATERCGAT
jgi:hypothetical protein